MEITYKTISKMYDDYRFQSNGFDWCDEYGEPGYGSTNTRGILLANWWCPCGKVREDDPREEGATRAALHGFDHHYPRLFAALEEQGWELEWSDEWVVEHNASKCYRTTGDSYSWQSSILWTDGDFLIPDDGIDAWIEELVDNPRRCMSSRVWSRAELAAAGFVQYERDDPHQYETGWHPGQDDDPEEITREIRERMGEEVEVLFYLDGAGQFDVRFSAWTRGGQVRHYHAGHNTPGYLPMDDEPFAYATFDDARSGLLEDMTRYVDIAVMEDNDLLVQEIDAAMLEVGSWEGQEGAIVVTDPTREHDLGTVYWVVECHEGCEEEEG